MLWMGHLSLTLRPGYAMNHVPCHLDCQIRAARSTGQLDHGKLDHTLNMRGNGFRAEAVYHARRSLGRIGSQHLGYDDVEEAFGMSRTYSIEIGNRERTLDLLKALQDLNIVESVSVQTLAMTPMMPDPRNGRAKVLSARDAWEPHERIHAREALAMEEGDERVTVAVVDTGVSLGHPELQRRLLAGYDTVDLGMGRMTANVQLIGDSQGYDFAPRDEVGHGSHVAGVIGAQGWRVPPGIGGRSLILPIRVLAAASIGSVPKRMGVGGVCDIDAGLKIACDLGAKVINMSLGTPQSSIAPDAPRPHTRAVRYATHLGCVLIAAAGNSGMEERFYPAALPEVIAVGSVDQKNQRSRFSTWGDHIALCAPGEQVVSLGMRGYKVSTGTSHAAPFVAGVAALMVSRARKAGRELNGSDVRKLLVESVTRLSDEGFSKATGYGVLDAAAALQHLDRALASAQPPGRKR